MSVINVARSAISQWEPATPYELVCRAAALLRELIPMASPSLHPKWQQIADAFSAEHVVSFTTLQGRPHRALLLSWWHITDDSSFLIHLDHQSSQFVGIMVGLSITLLEHCPAEESDPDYVAPISFSEMKRRLLAHIDMYEKVFHA